MIHAEAEQLLAAGAVVTGFKDLVLGLEVEEGARGNGNDELTVQRGRHAGIVGGSGLTA